MRLLGGVLALAGTAVLAGAAAAAVLPPVPPIPPVPTVPITVPSNPLPVPVLSPSPAPVPSPAGSPSTPVPKLPAPVAAAAQTGTTAVQGSQSSNTSSSGGSVASADRSRSSGSRVDNFRSSRRWIGTTGSKHRRTTTFVFVLSRAGRVVFAVDQISPACRQVGRFSVAAHAGVNRVRFGGRMHGRQLAPGTYRISARTVAGRVVRRITLAVVAGPAPSRDELSSLRAANVCEAGAGDTSFTAAGATSAGPTQPQSPSQTQASGPGLDLPHPPNLNSGVLGSSVQKTAKALQPLLLALLAVAIVLLGVASLPRAAVSEPHFNDLLARHRAEITALGATTLVAVALAFLLA